jgi:hypothetical protein
MLVRGLGHYFLWNLLGIGPCAWLGANEKFGQSKILKWPMKWAQWPVLHMSFKEMVFKVLVGTFSWLDKPPISWFSFVQCVMQSLDRKGSMPTRLPLLFCLLDSLRFVRKQARGVTSKRMFSCRLRWLWFVLVYLQCSGVLQRPTCFASRPLTPTTWDCINGRFGSVRFVPIHHSASSYTYGFCFCSLMPDI